jgi:serine/threonine-protein kinase
MASDGAQSDPTNDAPAPAAPNTPKPATPAPKPATPAQPTPDSPAPAPADGSTDACGNAKGQLFPPGAPWNTEISDAPLDSESDAIIDYLDANHNTGTRFQIDFGFRVLHAAAGEPHKAFTPNDDFYEGDCDPAPMPVPSGGGIEGEDGYACESDGDCHLIVVSESECRLYEMWRADIRGNDFNGGCMALWSIDKVYGPEGRGDFCTSADAAGLPITPLLFSADEVYNGEIAHAIRFILPNEHIRESIFVRPGTHSTGATSGPSDSPPYSARLRMRADADISGLSKGGQVVARALQKYGMFLADGGNLTFTGQSDQDTEHSWDEAELTPQDLKGLSWTDFEVVELGERIDYDSGSCEREPIAE